MSFYYKIMWLINKTYNLSSAHIVLSMLQTFILYMWVHTKVVLLREALSDGLPLATDFI